MPSPGSVRQVAGVWKCADGGSCTGREAVNRRRTPSAFGRADTGTVQCSSREPCRLALGRFIIHAKASGTGSKTPGGAGTHTGHTGTRYCSQVSAVVGEPRCAHTGTVRYPSFLPSHHASHHAARLDEGRLPRLPSSFLSSTLVGDHRARTRGSEAHGTVGTSTC